MSLSTEEAAQSLRNVADTQRRSREALGYSRSSPFLLALGVYWALGYGATQFWPRQAGAIWTIGAALFMLVVIGLVVAYQMAPHDVASKAKNLRFAILFGVVVPAFAFASLVVFWPVGPVRMGAFIPLIYGSVYAAMGLWLGTRYLVVGIVVALATLGGYFFLREYFAIWMAIIGGGAMILTGFWLRRA